MIVAPAAALVVVGERLSARDQSATDLSLQALDAKASKTNSGASQEHRQVAKLRSRVFQFTSITIARASLPVMLIRQKKGQNRN
jgi:hypothetical protein